METDSLERFGFIITESKKPNSAQTFRVRAYPLCRDARIHLNRLKKLGITMQDAINFAVVILSDEIEGMTEEERQFLVETIKSFKNTSFSEPDI